MTGHDGTPGGVPERTSSVASVAAERRIDSLAGSLRPGEGLVTRPPFRAPHHSATRSSILGGGTGRIHPGEVSRARVVFRL